MTHTQTQGADGAGSYVDWDNLNRLFAQMPSGPWVVSRDTAGHEIRQIDTDPTNKHHWPFHLCRSIPGQRAACDDAVFDFIAGVLNAWPQISAERSEEAEIERILAMPEDDLRKRFLANGESPEQAATISRLCFDAASLRVALTRISEQYVTHRGDMTDAEALRAIKSIADAALAAKASTPAPATTPGVPDSVRALLDRARTVLWRTGPACPDMTGDADAIVREIGALIAAQPAGQAGNAGIEATQITLGEGMVDITRIDHEGRTGVLFRPRKERIPFGEPGELPEGTYWPVKGDVVLWVSGEGPGVAIKALADLAPNSTRTGQEKDTFFTSDGFSADLIEAPRSRLPALNSTRTGAAEPCLRAVVEVYSGRTDTRLTFGKGVKHEGGCKAVEQAIIALQAELDQRDACPAAGGPSAGYGETGAKALSAAILAQCASPHICSGNGRVAEGIRCGPCERKALAAALAARPEAPSDAGWRERVRHVKLGTEYEVLGEAEAQVSGSDSRITESRDWLTDAIILEDGDKLTVYRGTDGRLWCRPTDEMRDGRFETITPPSDPAPSDAGWSREDLEAFVAREWPEGRSAGAAARELVRALGVRGLAPTLQRLLTDLLGQINFASTDRAQILADFANAAPEAARMAKIDSFERWNPRVFDPTPPSDPAPSGQAEG